MDMTPIADESTGLWVVHKAEVAMSCHHVLTSKAMGLENCGFSIGRYMWRRHITAEKVVDDR